jgi:hypothetical protein
LCSSPAEEEELASFSFFFLVFSFAAASELPELAS